MRVGVIKDKDDVNRRDVCECDGWVCVLEMMGSPSKLSVMCKVAVFVRVRPTLFFNYTETTTQRQPIRYDRCPIYTYRSSLLWIDKARDKDKKYIWVSVWRKTTN